MTTENKEVPSNKRKRVTASARARISIKKIRKVANTEAHGSVIQTNPPANVSTEHASSQIDPSNQSIMAMLTDIAQSTRSLAGRVKKLELLGTSTSSLINPGSHRHDRPLLERQPPFQPQYIHQDQAQRGGQTQAHAIQTLVPPVDVPIQGTGIVATDQHVLSSNVDHHRDHIMPDINTEEDPSGVGLSCWHLGQL